MAEQLRGVQRAIVAQEEDRPVAAPSSLFTLPQRAGIRLVVATPDGGTQRPTWGASPPPQVSTDDPAAGYLAALSASDSEQMIRQLRAAPTMTIEVELRLAGALIDAGEIDDAMALLDEIEDATAESGVSRGSVASPLSPAVTIRRLAAASPPSTRSSRVKLPPKLALGLACECDGALEEAASWSGIVAGTDRRRRAPRSALHAAGSRSAIAPSCRRIPPCAQHVDRAH